MQRISDYTFISMKGAIPRYGPAIREIDARPGKHGHDFKNDGYRGRPFRMQTKSTHASESEAQQAKQDYEMLVGEIVPVENGSVSDGNIMVLNVDECTIVPIGASTDGNTHLVTTSWLMQKTGESSYE